MGTRITRKLHPLTEQVSTLIGHPLHVELHDGRTLRGTLVGYADGNLVLRDTFKNLQLRKGYSLHNVVLQEIAVLTTEDSAAAF